MSKIKKKYYFKQTLKFCFRVTNLFLISKDSLESFKGFSPRLYKKYYFDVEAMTDSQAWSHFYGQGKSEGRFTSYYQLIKRLKIVDFSFNPREYLLANSDLLDKNLSVKQAFIQYITFGYKEERFTRSFVITKSDLIVLDKIFEKESRFFQKLEPFVSYRLRDYIKMKYKLKQINLKTINFNKDLMRLFKEVLSRPYSAIEFKTFFELQARGELSTNTISNYMAQAIQDSRGAGRMNFRFENEPSRIPFVDIVGGDIRHYSNHDASTLHQHKSHGGNTTGISKNLDKKVSIITSLYDGDKYITNFLKNITNLYGFNNSMELIIIDSNSPGSEFKVISEFQKKFPNIIYKRYKQNHNIYKIWNDAIQISTGEFITNANVDDFKFPQSVSKMADFLSRNLEYDAVFTDYIYYYEFPFSLEHRDVNEKITNLPFPNKSNILNFNSPHAAPLWRKSLHDEIGLFSEEYESAADWEFWIRSLYSNRKIFKLRDPLIAYYLNPAGISTKKDSKGIKEQWPIRTKYMEYFNEFMEVINENTLFDSVASSSIENEIMKKFITNE